ncbi:MAG: GNAT family N-acetyltransferase [Rhodocyclaceae bacterium]
MHIRPLHAADLHALLGLYRHLHVADDPLPEPTAIEAIWHEIIASARFRYFGVFIDDVLVASCNLTIIPNLTRGCRPHGVIENVVTHAAHRRKGLGKAVIAHAVEFARHDGCYKVVLTTSRQDEGTLTFYASTGMDPLGKRAFITRFDQPAG